MAIDSSLAREPSLEPDRAVGERRAAAPEADRSSGPSENSCESVPTTVERMQVGAERGLALDRQSGRQVVQDVPEVARLLARDVDVEEAREPQARTTGAVGRQHVRSIRRSGRRSAGRRSSGGRTAGVASASSPTSPKNVGADDPVRQSTGRTGSNVVGDVDGRRRAGLEVVERTTTVPPRTTAGRSRRCCRGVLDRALEAAVLEAEVGLDERDRRPAVSARIARRDAEADRRGRGRAPGRPAGRRARTAVPVPPKKSPLTGGERSAPPGTLDLERAARSARRRRGRPAPCPRSCPARRGRWPPR